MAAAAFQFFEVVKILSASDTSALGIVGSEGVVLGIADDEPPKIWYSVLIGDRTFGVAEENLASCNRFVPREDIYDGTSIRADSEGNVLPKEE